MFIFMMMMSLILVLMIYLIFYVVSFKMMVDKEMSSVYECGFDIKSSNRMMFSYRFFLIAVLFLIFDVEIVLMLPIPMMSSGFFFNIFVVILIGGLVYEFFCGSLEWL